MDDRRRLLERVYSRAGAAEEPEDHVDPVSGRTVRMTPSQWALDEYDRAHAPHEQSDGPDDAASGATGDGMSSAGDASTDASSAGGSVAGPGHPVRRKRLTLPSLAAAGGLVLGVALTIGVESSLGSAPLTPPASTQSATGPGADAATTGPGGVLSGGPGDGEGDEGATLVAVTEFFANTPGVDNLPPNVTKGFDATSFHEVAGTVVMQESSAIYAARRLDDEYCLVAVTDAGRAAETCGTLDDLTRRGLTLTKDVSRDIDGRPLAVTVTWQTDGTISWDAMPSAG